MVHKWLLHLDSPGNHLRLCFLDFTKAFDRIGYNVLIEKLIELGVRRSLLPWIINFLTNRRQRVKIGEIFSDWLPISAGVPQGTKVGPILFLVMINSLNTTSQESSIWKFVDDVSLSEALTRNSNSSLQSDLDNIGKWSADNWMKLKAKKCKEMRICYLKEKPQITQLHIDGQALELVCSYKILGLTIQNNLKWNEHVNAVISKASKRLHILRILRRGGVSSNDLFVIHMYCMH